MQFLVKGAVSALSIVCTFNNVVGDILFNTWVQILYHALLFFSMKHSIFNILLLSRLQFNCIRLSEAT